MGTTPARLAQVVAAVSRELPVAIDGWRPTVQGAVGHVVGVRGPDGSPYALKTYPAGALDRALTERLALDRLGGVPGVPVPDVVLAGRTADPDADPDPAAYVLLSRLPGVRWADRRTSLSTEQNRRVAADLARVLRRVHRLAGRRFGPLLADGGSWATAWERADARCDELVRQDLLAGGSGELCGRVRRFVDRYHDAIGSCIEPVLCHNDANGGNVLVTATGEPRICGVVDLERASWDDPLCDLARTRQHVRHHDPGGVASVTAAYGVAEEGERLRLDVHELLHVLEERTWIVHDRPVGWQRSVAALEQQLWQRT